MHVIFHLAWQIIVKHMANRWYINTTRSNVRRYHDIIFAIFNIS